MARLYANENFPLPVVMRLRELGHDVLTTVDSGQSDQAISDEAVLAFAVSQSRAVITLNRKHFVKLHRERGEHFGIVVCTFDAQFDRQALRIDAALRSVKLLEGQLIRVNRPSTTETPSPRS